MAIGQDCEQAVLEASSEFPWRSRTSRISFQPTPHAVGCSNTPHSRFFDCEQNWSATHLWNSKIRSQELFLMTNEFWIWSEVSLHLSSIPCSPFCFLGYSDGPRPRFRNNSPSSNWFKILWQTSLRTFPCSSVRRLGIHLAKKEFCGHSQYFRQLPQGF